MKFFIILFFVFVSAIIVQKILIEKFRPSVNDFNNQVSMEGELTFRSKKNGYVSLINEERIYCFVSFAKGDSCVGLNSIREHSIVIANVVYLKTSVGLMPFVMSLYSKNKLVIKRTPEQALTLWDESSTFDMYTNSILCAVLVTIIAGLKFAFLIGKVRND